MRARRHPCAGADERHLDAHDAADRLAQHAHHGRDAAAPTRRSRRTRSRRRPTTRRARRSATGSDVIRSSSGRGWRARASDELDARHLGVVALTRPQLQDPQVPTVAVEVARCDVADELVVISLSPRYPWI
jgi:hypothetical protein